jgi:hypothetical protein
MYCFTTVSEMAELENGKIYETLSRNAVLITVTASEIKINDSAITESIPASNGIIYVIDTFLLSPPSPTELPMPVPIPPPTKICPELPSKSLGFKSYEEYQDGPSCNLAKLLAVETQAQHYLILVSNGFQCHHEFILTNHSPFAIMITSA